MLSRNAAKIYFIWLIGSFREMLLYDLWIDNGGVSNDNLGIDTMRRAKQFMVVHKGMETIKKLGSTFIAGDLVNHHKEMSNGLANFAHFPRNNSALLAIRPLKDFL